MFAYLIETYNSMNKELFITTASFFIFGLIYYFAKIYNQTSQPLPVIVPQGEQHLNQQQQQQQHQNNEEPIEVSIQIRQDKKKFTIEITDNIGVFIHNHIKPLIGNEGTPNLFCQGRQLDPSQQFSSYPSITNGTVLLCIIRAANQENNRQPEYNSSTAPIGTSVSIYTLLTHAMIFLLMCLLIFYYKHYKDLFTHSTLILIQVLGVVWAFFFSKTFAVFCCYRTIIYD